MNKFILPEKWYVERTYNNANIVNEWACSLQGTNCAYRTTPCYFLNNGKYRSINTSGIHKFVEGHTLITYEQFLEYIVNKKPIIEDTLELNQILIKLLTE